MNTALTVAWYVCGAVGALILGCAAIGGALLAGPQVRAWFRRPARWMRRRLAWHAFLPLPLVWLFTWRRRRPGRARWGESPGRPLTWRERQILDQLDPTSRKEGSR